MATIVDTEKDIKQERSAMGGIVLTGALLIFGYIAFRNLFKKSK